MSKTPFRMPQRPAPTEALDQWVAGATPLPPAEAPLAEKPAKPARLTIDLPPELHARFKAACALNGTRMVDQVRTFIEEWTQKHR